MELAKDISNYGVKTDDFDINKLNSMDLSGLTQKFCNPAQEMVDIMNRENQAGLRALEATRREKEAKELRRHNEIVATLKEAGENGATIVIGDNANGIQIQQNAQNANQTMINFQEFNYSQALNVLNEIKEYFDMPKFTITFQDKTDIVKQIVSETIEAIERNEDVSLIQKSLRILKDLAVGTGGSLIATGIIGLLNTLLI